MNVHASAPSVLLADDDVIMRKLLSDFFSGEGWNFDIASDGDTAVDAVQKNRYDLIVTDLKMPGLCGLPLLNKLQELSPAQPIVVVSGEADFAQAEQLLKQESAVDFIAKPVDMELLASAVERVVGAAARSKNGVSSAELTICEERYEFSTAELARIKFPLAIAERIQSAGLIDNNTRLRLELAFQEAVANAVEHGNLELASRLREEYDEQGVDRFSKLKKERLEDPQYAERKVFIQIQYAERRLTLVVEDQGPGFTPASEEEKEQRVQSAEEVAVHGRGVSLIRGTMSEVKYDNGGRRLTMMKSF